MTAATKLADLLGPRRGQAIVAKVRAWLGLTRREGAQGAQGAQHGRHAPPDTPELHALHALRALDTPDVLDVLDVLASQQVLAGLPFIKDVVDQPVESVFGDRLYLGMLNILDGDPGLGKTLVALDLAARLAARLVARDPRDAATVVLASNKNNLAVTPASLAYRVAAAAGMDPDEGRPPAVVVWQGVVAYTADALLASLEATREREPSHASAVQRAVTFLSERLAGGPVGVRTIQSEAAAQRPSITAAALDRAKAALRLRVFKQGPAWYWELPEGEQDEQDMQGMQLWRVGGCMPSMLRPLRPLSILGGIGGLREGTRGGEGTRPRTACGGGGGTPAHRAR